MVVSESFVNILDIVILVCFVFLVFFGYQKGFLSKLFGLFGSVLFLYLSWKLSGLLAEDFAVLPHRICSFLWKCIGRFFLYLCKSDFLVSRVVYSVHDFVCHDQNMLFSFVQAADSFKCQSSYGVCVCLGGRFFADGFSDFFICDAVV